MNAELASQIQTPLLKKMLRIFHNQANTRAEA